MGIEGDYGQLVPKQTFGVENIFLLIFIIKLKMIFQQEILILKWYKLHFPRVISLKNQTHEEKNMFDKASVIIRSHILFI